MSANPIKIVTLIIGQMSRCQMKMGQLECYNQNQKETVSYIMNVGSPYQNWHCDNWPNDKKRHKVGLKTQKWYAMNVGHGNVEIKTKKKLYH
jgi:hypothetical protein